MSNDSRRPIAAQPQHPQTQSSREAAADVSALVSGEATKDVVGPSGEGGRHLDGDEGSWSGGKRERDHDGEKQRCKIAGTCCEYYQAIESQISQMFKQMLEGNEEKQECKKSISSGCHVTRILKCAPPLLADTDRDSGTSDKLIPIQTQSQIKSTPPASYQEGKKEHPQLESVSHIIQKDCSTSQIQVDKRETSSDINQSLRYISNNQNCDNYIYQGQGESLDELEQREWKHGWQDVIHNRYDKSSERSEEQDCKNDGFGLQPGAGVPAVETYSSSPRITTQQQLKCFKVVPRSFFHLADPSFENETLQQNPSISNQKSDPAEKLCNNQIEGTQNDQTGHSRLTAPPCQPLLPQCTQNFFDTKYLVVEKREAASKEKPSDACFLMDNQIKRNSVLEAPQSLNLEMQSKSMPNNSSGVQLYQQSVKSPCEIRDHTQLTDRSAFADTLFVSQLQPQDHKSVTPEDIKFNQQLPAQLEKVSEKEIK